MIPTRLSIDAKWAILPLVVVFALLFVVSNSTPVQAQTPTYSYSLATGGNHIPWNPNISTTWQKWQGHYGPGTFTGAFPGNITKVYFMRAANTSGTTYSNFGVYLGQSTSSTFSTSAWFTPVTQALSASSYTVPAGSNGTWFQITLTTPVYYNPNQALVVQICSNGVTGGAGFPVREGGPAPGNPAPNVGRLYGGGNGCATAAPSGSTSNYHANFGFDIAPATPDNAGITELLSPVAFCAGTEDIKVKLVNLGTNTLNSVTIDWTYNGVPQPTINYATPLASFADATVTLGTKTFTAGTPTNLVAWTSLPNGNPDTFTANDTLMATLQPSLSGTFTIGGASPDYADFSAAVADLNAYGVCGPVVFNVRSGTYNERVALSGIIGASAVNTITFQSETGNRADVTINYASTSAADNGVITLGSSKFVTFKNMTMRNTASGTYCAVVNLGSSTDGTIESCELIGPTVGTTSYNAAVVYGYDGANHRTTINNCGIRNGSMGGYMRGSSTTSTQDYCVITNNEITDQYYTGWYSYYEGYLTFHDNKINLGPGYSYMYLTFFYYGNNMSIERNNWFGSGRNYAYGIYFYYQNYYVPGNSRFVNNMVTLTGQTYQYRAMYKYRSYNTLFAHNTMTMDGNYANGYLLYDYYPSGCEYYNNILYHTGAGYAWYVNPGSAVVNSDYNVLYTAGNNFVYWSGNRADLTALQAASGMDQNSITKTVFFRNLAIGDLHLTGSSEDDAALFGTLLPTVVDDIDHELRVQPYRGADEACYVLPGALTYEFVDGAGLQTAYAEAPGTVGIKYGVTFPPFASTITFTVQFFDVINNTLVYQTSFQASKQANVDLFGTQYITLPPTLAAGAYRVEVIFNTKNSCDVYRDYMPYPSALLVVPEGRVPCVVWPGDANNDGIVNYTDRRDLNYYIYNANLRTSWLNGPPRYRADAEINPFTYLEWEPQAAAPWFTPEGCYMDTDGNGTINNLDYLAMKLNWSKNTPWYGGAPKSGVAAMSFTMDQNYPNPFNPSTMIHYTAAEASHVRLVVTDALGRQVAELENGRVDAGMHDVQFDGSALASGTYIATITMTGVESGLTFTKTIKMALNK